MPYTPFAAVETKYVERVQVCMFAHVQVCVWVGGWVGRWTALVGVFVVVDAVAVVDVVVFVVGVIVVAIVAVGVDVVVVCPIFLYIVIDFRGVSWMFKDLHMMFIYCCRFPLIFIGFHRLP